MGNSVSVCTALKPPTVEGSFWLVCEGIPAPKEKAIKNYQSPLNSTPTPTQNKNIPRPYAKQKYEKTKVTLDVAANEKNSLELQVPEKKAEKNKQKVVENERLRL